MNATGDTGLNAHSVGRRQFVKYGAVAGAAAVIGPGVPALASPARADTGHAHPHVLPAPKPIPGGAFELPGGGVAHVFAPGPPEVTLPFSGAPLGGLDVEPSVITDYSGVTALAYHVGTAVGHDGTRYNLETDMRAFQGTYIAANGERRRGSFGFV
jgi:hypothetical protein